MSRFLFLLAVVLLVLSSSDGQSANPGSAIGALNALPPAYRGGVVWVSADNADPHPDQWLITARNTARGGLLMNLTVARGRVISERPTISPRALTGQLSPMNLASIRVNSTDLWRSALRFSDTRGRRLGSLSLQLQQRGRHATPVWSIWCYDRRGGYIGFFSALATTGAITSR